MNCKNCNSPLNINDRFCATCGAKIIKNRLTLKTITSEFFETFISWDNQLFKTFKLLITKPESVIVSYINGTRKRYVKPFTYLLIALSLYGIFLNFANDLYVAVFSNGFKFNNENISFDKEYIQRMKKITMLSTKYFNFFMMLMIPFYSLLSKKAFKKYNFVEHIIIITYIQAETFISSTFLISILILFNVNILLANSIISPFAYIYLFYVFMRVFKLSFIDTLVNFLIMIAYLILITIVISITVGLIIGLINLI